MSDRRERIRLVPRFEGQGYRAEDVVARRQWVEETTGTRLEHVAASTLDPETLRGNIENPIGSVQMPLGIAGPLKVIGEHLDEIVYVPLATTEGALVRSYERGMVCTTRSGGVTVRILDDHNVMAPSFFFADTAAAVDFARGLPGYSDALREVVAGTTRHGRLEELRAHVVGREVIVALIYHTGDAHGMNMISRASHAVCEWLVAQTTAERYLVFSGMECEKRAGGYLWDGHKGKKVVAGAEIPARLARTYLHVTPEQMVDLQAHTRLGHLQAGAVGYNGHLANGLTALLIATGQDVANVANAAVGITNFEVTESGDLYASVTLPSLTLATVGGGVGLGTSRECLALLGCSGAGRIGRLTEIVAATLLAGELSFGAAIASGEFVEAHETYGRNRPKG